MIQFKCMLFWRNSKYKIPFLIIFSALLIGGVLFYFGTGKNVPDGDTQDTEKEAIIPEGWVAHSDSTLRIEFHHPPEWGPIERRTEPCLIDGQYHPAKDGQPCRHVFFLAKGLEEGPLVLSSESMLFAEYMQERSQYFGDLISVVRKQNINVREFISTYCQKEAGAKGGERCETEAYPNGVIITKSVQGPIIPNDNNKDKKIAYYIIYRPNSPYDHLIFSTEFLPDSMPLEESEKIMDDIAATLRFL